MKEKLKLAKQKMNDESRPYNTYCYYLTIPVTFIVVMILSTFGLIQGSSGNILLILTILANIDARKLELVSRRKYVAPILLYVSNIISLALLPILFTDLSMGAAGDTYFVLLGLIVFPVQVLMIVFFFIGANDIKKAYPTMKEDAKSSRENYKQLKKSIRV